MCLCKAIMDGLTRPQKLQGIATLSRCFSTCLCRLLILLFITHFLLLLIYYFQSLSISASSYPVIIIIFITLNHYQYLLTCINSTSCGWEHFCHTRCMSTPPLRPWGGKQYYRHSIVTASIIITLSAYMNVHKNK